MPEEKVKKHSGKHIVLILLCVCCVVLITGLCFLFVTREKHRNTETTKTTVEETTQSIETTKTTKATTLPQTTNSVEIPQELKSALSKNELSVDDLTEAKCQQLVVVEKNDGKVIATFFQQTKGKWSMVEETATQVFIGKNGITKNKTEGDRCTPVGFYKIGSAFYINKKPETKLDSFQINDQSYWVDDPESAFYNQYVVGTDKKDWNSAEHMIDYGVYRYGFVVEYNTACKPGLGSAIFFHIGNSYTAGCIATQEDYVLRYLSLLDKEKNPYILII